MAGVVSMLAASSASIIAALIAVVVIILGFLRFGFKLRFLLYYDYIHTIDDMPTPIHLIHENNHNIINKKT